MRVWIERVEVGRGLGKFSFAGLRFRGPKASLQTGSYRPRASVVFRMAKWQSETVLKTMTEVGDRSQNKVQYKGLLRFI